MAIIHCPVCKKEVTRENNTAFPFCGPRCKTRDLGAWLNGDYAIPAEEENPSSEARSPLEADDF